MEEINKCSKIERVDIKEINQVIKLFETLHDSIFSIQEVAKSNISFVIKNDNGNNRKLSIFCKRNFHFSIYPYHYKKLKIKGLLLSPRFEEDKKIIDKLFDKKFKLSKINVNFSELDIFFDIENNDTSYKDNKVVFNIRDVDFVEINVFY